MQMSIVREMLSPESFKVTAGVAARAGRNSGRCWPTGRGNPPPGAGAGQGVALADGHCLPDAIIRVRQDDRDAFTESTARMAWTQLSSFVSVPRSSVM